MSKLFRRLRHYWHEKTCPVVDRWGIGGNPQRVITRFYCGYKTNRLGNVYDAIGPYNNGKRSIDRCGKREEHRTCLLWAGHDGPHFSASISEIF